MGAEVNLVEWLKERHVWLQRAAIVLVEKDCIDRSDITEFVDTCIKEVLGEANSADFTIPRASFEDSAIKCLRLCSIQNITGINALAPRNPLVFGDRNLTVIYGNNGSGKSGYVRLLKHMCGARYTGILHKNVYCPTPTKQTCSITYSVDGNPTSQEWEATGGIIDDLRGVDIFDTQCGHVYVKDENEVTYEPPALSFFSELIDICGEVSTEINNRIENLVSQKPALPAAYADTTPGIWYTELTAKSSAAEITANCSWDSKKAQKLEELSTRLSEQAPTDKARHLRTQKTYLDSIITKIETLHRQLSDENRSRLLDLKKDADQKGDASRVAAERMFSEAPLDGVGTQVWTLLWEHARKYSEQVAYPGRVFPSVDSEALCVLCHQPLSPEAQQRFLSFEEYVKGELRTAADSAKTTFDDAVSEIADLPTAQALRTEADAAGLDQKSYDLLQAVFAEFKLRKDTLLGEAPQDLPEVSAWIHAAKLVSNGYQDAAEKFDEDAKGDNREELRKAKLDLEVTKWLSEQRESIDGEISRLLQHTILQEALKLTNTSGLSKKKGELANSLITDAFIQRFNDELKKLNASRIHVELVKSRVPKGRVLHCLQLKEAHAGSPTDVLSEGEFRMISLAAFLADVTGTAHTTPFVFDDPISSLDQDFEEAVVQRLVELAKARQVIVFTHRLSLLGMIQFYTEKANIAPEVICISKEPWGTGEPGETPTWAEKPKKANNILLDQRLREAQKVYQEQGQRAYEIHAQSICSDFRKLLERTVEYDLMSDVVQRFRRDVMTKKMCGLSKITAQDCQTLDELMTKYCRYEHSQPSEAPVPLPTPEELKKDLEELKAWREEFANRVAP